MKFKEILLRPPPWSSAGTSAERISLDFLLFSSLVHSGAARLPPKHEASNSFYSIYSTSSASLWSPCARHPEGGKQKKFKEILLRPPPWSSAGTSAERISLD